MGLDIGTLSNTILSARKERGRAAEGSVSEITDSIVVEALNDRAYQNVLGALQEVEGAYACEWGYGRRSFILDTGTVDNNSRPSYFSLAKLYGLCELGIENAGGNSAIVTLYFPSEKLLENAYALALGMGTVDIAYFPYLPGEPCILPSDAEKTLLLFNSREQAEAFFSSPNVYSLIAPLLSEPVNLALEQIKDQIFKFPADVWRYSGKPLPVDKSDVA